MQEKLVQGPSDAVTGRGDKCLAAAHRRPNENNYNPKTPHLFLITQQGWFSQLRYWSKNNTPEQTQSLDADFLQLERKYEESASEEWKEKKNSHIKKEQERERERFLQTSPF